MYKDGAVVQQIFTSFETKRVTISNLPPAITVPDLFKAIEELGEVQNLTIEPAGTDQSVAMADYTTSVQAMVAVQELNNFIYQGRQLHAKMDAQAVEDGSGTLRSTKVKVSWFAPSRIAWAHYDGLSFAKKQAQCLNGREFNGYKVTTSFQIPTYRQRDSFSVEVRGLPPHFSAAHLKGFCDADAVTLGECIDYSAGDVVLKLRQLLEKSGALESFETLPTDRGKAKMVAFAQFVSADAAECAVRELNGTRPPLLARSPLWLEHIHSVKYMLPLPIFTIIKPEIDALRDDPDLILCRLRYYEKDADGLRHDPVCLRVYGSDAKILGKLKAKCDSLIAGDLFVDENKTRIWDPYFETPEGLFFMRQVSQATHTYLKSETRLRTIRLFGLPQSVEHARAKILEKLASVLKNRHIIQLDRAGLRMLVTGGFSQLVDVLGKRKLALDVSQRTLTVRGDDEDLRRVHAMLSQSTPGSSAIEMGAETQETCPVCFCDATDPRTLPCGHAYCKPCLQHYLRAPPSTKFDGMVCIAEADSAPTKSCSQPVPYHIIRALLSPSEEEELLRASFLAYVHSRPDEFHYCPTPDCETLYRPGCDDTVLRCPSCLIRICAACHVEFHEGLACAAYRDNVSGGYAAYEKWRAKNNVKACPRCKTDIMKDGGCNHMTCRRCGAHICWVCMKTFNDEDSSGGVYAHMAREHGGSH
ncbi:hypothetical protein EIP86_007502 [Pleurotus ostreatoroseus]|nr:hypothetical protein EIP86_007502 [Pleurotus ostreatoroseus]